MYDINKTVRIAAVVAVALWYAWTISPAIRAIHLARAEKEHLQNLAKDFNITTALKEHAIDDHVNASRHFVEVKNARLDGAFKRWVYYIKVVRIE